MKNSILFCFLFLGLNSITAQGIGNLLLAGEDASLLTENYLSPAASGLMSGMNSGWYSTAKTHKKLGFDITIGTSMSFMPSSAQTFNFKPDQYNYISVANNSSSELPTVLSDNDSNTTFDVAIPTLGGDLKVGSFTMPGGVAGELPFSAIPTAFVQVGLGLPTKTDLKLRYAPEINYDSKVKGSSIGIGVQHDLTQYLGLVSKLPFSVAVLGAYSKVNIEYAIDSSNLSSGITTTNGLASFKLDTWTVQALGSLDLKIVTIYGGVGYNSGTSNFDVDGDYTLTYDVQDSNQNSVGTVTETVSDPISLGFNSSGARATVGARLNLLFFKIFADYTIQEYNTASAGVAFSFR
jgi:hypothetical protein|tara:strand:- start:23 stop:1072 length:1050 start_codon:yes stop_codon:yes gene_type:complete